MARTPPAFLAWIGAVASPVLALGVALPAHYPNHFDTLGHLGLIYLATLIFVVGGPDDRQGDLERTNDVKDMPMSDLLERDLLVINQKPKLLARLRHDLGAQSHALVADEDLVWPLAGAADHAPDGAAGLPTKRAAHLALGAEPPLNRDVRRRSGTSRRVRCRALHVRSMEPDGSPVNRALSKRSCCPRDRSAQEVSVPAHVQSSGVRAHRVIP